VDKTELKELIAGLIDRVQEMDEIDSIIDKVIGYTPDSRLGTVIYNMIDAQVELIERLAGCKDNLLSWFIWENDCGERGLEAGIIGDMREIRTVDDLIWVLEITGE